MSNFRYGISIPFEYDINKFDFLWRIAEQDFFFYNIDDCPYVELATNRQGELVLFNWCDTAVVVNFKTGELIRKYQTI